MGQAWRRERLSSEIVKETSRILLHEMMDPRKGFVTVTRAKVSEDYRYAKIFVSVMGTAKQKKLAMSGLQSARGFIQKELSRRIQMRAFPEVHFELDETMDKALKMQALLGDIKRKREGAALPPVEEKEEE